MPKKAIEKECEREKERESGKEKYFNTQLFWDFIEQNKPSKREHEHPQRTSHMYKRA